MAQKKHRLHAEILGGFTPRISAWDCNPRRQSRQQHLRFWLSGTHPQQKNGFWHLGLQSHAEILGVNPPRISARSLCFFCTMAFESFMGGGNWRRDCNPMKKWRRRGGGCHFLATGLQSHEKMATARLGNFIFWRRDCNPMEKWRRRGRGIHMFWRRDCNPMEKWRRDCNPTGSDCISAPRPASQKFEPLCI